MITFLCILCGIFVASQPVELTLTSTGRLRDHSVVRARIVSISEDRIVDFATEVEHVYGGNSALVGAQITGKSYELGNAFVLQLRPKPQIGEVGIWIVPDSPEGMELDAYTMHRMSQFVPIGFPARDFGSREPQENYENAVLWAEAVETLESLDEKDRVEKLEEYAASGHHVLSPWAINVLALGQDNVAFLHMLARDRALPVLAQVTLDEVLARLSPDDWLDSPERKALLESWPATATNENDSLIIVNRIERAVRNQALDAQLAHEMLVAIIKSEHTVLVRSRAVGVLRWVMSDPRVNGEVFDLLAKFLESDGDPKLRFPATETLSHVEKLNDERMAKLILLRDAYLEKSLQIEDPRDPIKRIASTLDETVRRLQKPKRPGDAPK